MGSGRRRCGSVAVLQSGWAATVWMVVGLAGPGGCSSCDANEPPVETGPGEARASATKAAEPTGAATPTRPTPSQARAPIEADRVRALVEGWVAAQNSGDFTTYARLYAERFEGVKRSGPRVRRFGREGWLDDRRRMFARPMVVKVRDLRVVTSATSAVVSLEQTWSSSSYRDVGPKQLVLVDEGEELRIAREEMLASKAAEPADGTAPPLDQFAFVIDAGGPSVVLHVEPERDWSEGPLRLVSDDGPVVVAQTAATAAIPHELRGWPGRRVQLYSAAGAACTATVRQLRVVRRVIPHFTSRAYWRGEHGDPPQPASAIADEVWKLGADGALLVGTLRAHGPCETPLWARAADAPPPMVLAATEGDAALEADALLQLRGLPAYRALQGEHDGYDDVERGRPWDEDGYTDRQVRIWRDAESGRTAVTAAIAAGFGCGSFQGRLWAAFERFGTGLRLRSDGAAIEMFRAIAVFDADGDGLLEYLTADALLRPTRRGYAPVQSIAPPDLDCEC